MSEQRQFLLPCPFCGSPKVEHTGIDELRWCHCRACGCESGFSATDEQASERWNKRAPRG